MEAGTDYNMTSCDFHTDAERLPLYLSAHSEIPNELLHELPVVLLTTGMVLNAFLIYYLVASRKYKSPVFMFVMFLASTDFLTCLSFACMAGFVWPVYLLPKRTWIVCKVMFYLLEVVGSASPYYLVLFAALRFYQLCFPLKARVRVTSSFVRNWCLLIMFVEILAWSPFLFSYTLIDVNYDGERSVACAYTGNLGKVTSFSFLIVNTCIPGISIPVLHFMKYIGVAKTKGPIELQQKHKNTDIRALMIVITIFYICWFPLNIFGVVYKHPPNHFPLQNRLFLVLLYVCCGNNVLNPVVYCLAASSVRIDIAQFLCKRKINKTKQRFT